MIVQADNERGTRVSFQVLATDNIDTTVEVFCDPPAGKVFPVGDTDVVCVATDSSDNSSYGSFVVTVLGQKNEGPGFDPEIFIPPT